MKPLLYFLAACITVWYIDYAYNRSLVQVYEQNKWVIERYCQPNILVRKGVIK